ncbi:MAG: hypothetical protein HQL15_09790 [Candidatus Omnitrophica bacterium]|nr:hypothetical protein [Candidatus Omnitrophota bacterium]
MFKKLFNVPSINLLITILSIGIGFFVYPQIISNIHKITYSINTGKTTTPTPMPLYGFKHLKNPDPYYKEITFAADFAAVYYTAKNFDKPNIYSGQYEANHRPVLYPPIIYYTYNKLFCTYPFPKAALLHLLLQAILLLLSSYFILRYYKLEIMFIPVCISYSLILFLTPVGLSEFERGQFDIYPALSILFFMFGIYESNSPAFAYSALFAALKWTIAPFFIQGFIIYLLISKDNKKFKFLGIFTGILLLTLAIFPEQSIQYLQTLYNAQNHHREGFSGITRIPAATIIFIFILSLLLYLIPLIIHERKNLFLKTFLPYMSGLAVLDLFIPSIAWEYRAIYLIGFIPMAIIWITKYTNNSLYKYSFLGSFILIIFIIFHGTWIIGKFPIKLTLITYVIYYVVTVFISISTITLEKDPTPPNHSFK